MSHTVQIKAQFKITQLSSFKRAVESLGWKILENSVIRTYHNDPARHTVYPMIAQNPNQGYDMGLKFNEVTGEIEVYWDPFDGSIAASLGNNVEKLKQEYAACVAEDFFTNMGWAATREVMQDGKIVVNGESM